MKIRYPEIAICGLSCRLCPHYHTEGPSRCGGCKTESRNCAGCPFITCARAGIAMTFPVDGRPKVATTLLLE